MTKMITNNKLPPYNQSRSLLIGSTCRGNWTRGLWPLSEQIPTWP